MSAKPPDILQHVDTLSTDSASHIHKHLQVSETCSNLRTDRARAISRF